jgi:hypothetical protein
MVVIVAVVLSSTVTEPLALLSKSYSVPFARVVAFGMTTVQLPAPDEKP